VGHQRRFKRKSRTSASPPIPDISLHRTALRPIGSESRRGPAHRRQHRQAAESGGRSGSVACRPCQQEFCRFSLVHRPDRCAIFHLVRGGQFPVGQRGARLIERQPASPLPRSGLDHCERSRLPTRAFSQQPPQGRRSGFSLAMSQAIPEPPLPAALVGRGDGRLLHRQGPQRLREIQRHW
jgi:hypothetical protein